MGGLVQIALALSVFAIMTGLGVGELAQYAQSRLPYTIVQRVVSAANLVNNAASSYIVQNTNCITGANGLEPGTGCNFETDALAYLPGAQTPVSYSTQDGSTITVAPVPLPGNPNSSTAFSLTITPGNIIKSKSSYIQALGNALPGAVCSSSPLQCVVTEATPSISNMLKANTPAWGTLAPGNGATQNVNGPLNTNGQPINNVAGDQQFQPYTTCGNVGCVTSSHQIWAQPCWAGWGCVAWNWYPPGAKVGSGRDGVGVSLNGAYAGGLIYSYPCGCARNTPYWNTVYGTSVSMFLY